MSFHTPFLALLLQRLPQNTDFWMGRTVIPSALKEMVSTCTGSDEGQWLKQQMADRVVWLVDNEDTLAQMVAMAQHLELCKLRIAIEFDVGMKRGGVVSNDEVLSLLAKCRKVQREQQYHLEVVGAMGFDGHIGGTPLLDGETKSEAMCRGFRIAHRRFKEMKLLLESSGDDVLVPPDQRIWDSSATGSFPLYGEVGYMADETINAANEVSLGSIFTLPTGFDGNPFLGPLFHPAQFVVSPVLKVQSSPVVEVANVDPAVPEAAGCGRGYYYAGGGWADRSVYPPGLITPTFCGVNPKNMVPNQRLLCEVLDVNAAAKAGAFRGDASSLSAFHGPTLRVGDLVVFRPSDGCAFAQFETILLVEPKEEGSWVVSDAVWRPLELRF